MNAMPPDPAFWGPDWRERWLERLEATPPWLIEWLRQQHDGPYWRGGLPRPRLRRDRGGRPQHRRLDGRVRRCGLPDAEEPRGTEPDDRGQLGPRPAVVGHARPEPRRAPRDGPVLRPLAEGHRERRRRGARDHLVRARVRGAGAVPGDVARPMARGERLSASGGGAPRLGLRGWSAAPRGRPVGGAGRGGGDDGRRGSATPTGVDRYRHRPTVGTRAALSWGAGGPPNGLARDLRPDEAFGPTYTSAPLDDALEILGVPEVLLHLSASSPVATVVVRLTDVAPDGTSAQVSAGILNLTHRLSHDHPATAGAGTSRRRSASSCDRRAIGSCQAIASGSPSPRPRGP